MSLAEASLLRFAAGLPRAGERRLERHEIAWLRRRWAALRRDLVLAAIAIVGSAIAIALQDPTARPIARLGGPAQAWLATMGLVGVLGCLAAGRGAWRICAALGSLYLLGMAAFGALDPRLTPRPHGLDAAVIVGMILLGTSFVVATVVARVAIAGRGKALGADLDGGVVERFTGPLPAHRPVGALARLSAIAPGDPEPVRLEVLPRSRVLVRINGRRVERWARVHVAAIAPSQPHALRVGLPRELVPTIVDPRLTLERRSLSPQERTEIGAHARRLRRRAGPVVAMTLAAIALVTWQLHDAGTLRDALDPLVLASDGLLAIALALLWAGYVRRLLAASKLDDDVRLRWVVTVRESDEAAASAERSAASTPPRLEVLPVSQLAWTEHARPAGWRLEEP